MRNLIVLIAGLVTACGPPARYIPPPEATAADFSREVNGSFDAVWSRVTNVAGATFFNIRNFDKGSGLMTLDYSNLKSVGPYVSCGTVSGGVRLVSVPNTQPNSVFNYTTIKRIALQGTGNITIRSLGPRRTLVQMNSLYTLTAYDLDSDGELQPFVEWKFTTQEPDVQVVPVDFLTTQVTCLPSYRLEQRFLDAVSAPL